MINWLRVNRWLRDVWKIRGGYERFPDSYALTRAKLWAALQHSMEARLQRDDLILLVAHFPSTFEQAQAWLDGLELEYGIAPPRMFSDWLQTQIGQAGPPRVGLALCETIEDTSPIKPLTITADRQMSVMALERHPQCSRDRKLDLFCRSWPCMVRIGYFLAIEDPLIQRFVAPGMLDLLHVLGISERALVTSEMLTRRLDIVLNRIEKRLGQRSDLAKLNEACCPEEWLAIFDAADADHKQISGK